MTEGYTFRQSELKAFMGCRRSWALAYIRQLVLKRGGEKVGTADTGTMFHLGLEHHYRDGLHPRSGLDAWWGDQSEETHERLAKNYRLAGIMLDGYQTEVIEQGEDARWEIIHVERRMTVPFGDILGVPVSITGKADLEVKDIDFGTHKIVDHKSVDGIKDERQLQIDFQGLTYATLRRLEDGTRLTEFVHNQAKRVLRTGTAKPPFYGRTAVSFNDEQLRSHWKHMHAILTEMVRLRQMVEANDPLVEAMLYPNVTKDCSWKCRYLPVCPMMDDGSDAEGFLAQWYEKADTIEPESEES